MKTKQTRKISLVIITMFLVFTGRAELPQLTTPAYVDLPQTFSNNDVSYGYIDIDGDEIYDYYVTYSGSNNFYISGNSGSMILRNSGDYMVELLNYGATIGPTPLLAELDWYNGSTIARWNMPVAPPTSTHSDGVNQGYIGLSFGGQYGWLNVSIDDDNQTVTLSSSGYDNTGNPTTAGLGDPLASTVPVPFIASALGLLAIGAGVVLRRKRKK